MQGMFLVSNHFQDADAVTLNADCVVGVAAVKRLPDRSVQIITSTPHGQKQEREWDKQLVLENFGRGLSGKCMLFKATGSHDLTVRIPCHDEDHTVVDQLVSHVLQGGELLVLPDRSTSAILHGSGNGVLYYTPRDLPRREIESAWKATLARAFDRKELPSAVKPIVPSGISISSCGIAACIGTYSRIHGRGEDAIGFVLGCARIAFEQCLGLWVLSASLRPSDNCCCHLRGSREALGEPYPRWEGPQLLYVCLDANPTGKWVCVLGQEPAPRGIELAETSVGHALPGLREIASSLDAGNGPFSAPVLSMMLGFLLDFSSADWRTFVEFSQIEGCRGPRGQTAGAVAQAIFNVIGIASQAICVSRAWAAAAMAWRGRWPEGLRQALPGGASVTSSVVILLARAGRRGPAHLLSITKDPAFVGRRWGAALESIKLVYRVPAHQQGSQAADVRVEDVGLAFLEFARQLFQDVGASWKDRKSAREACMKGHAYGTGPNFRFEATEKIFDFLECPWIRPEALRGRALILCEAAGEEEKGCELLTLDGQSISRARYNGAFRRLRSDLARTFQGLDPLAVKLTRETTGWSAKGQKGGYHPCPLHQRIGSGRQPNCARCKKQDTRGWSSLAATVKLEFSINFPDHGNREFHLNIVAPAIPFVVTTQDRKAGKLPGASKQEQLRRILA